MKRTDLSILVLVAASFFAPMAAPAQDDAPAMDALMAIEKQAGEALGRGDAKFFDGLLSGEFVTRQGRERLRKAALLKVIASRKCDVKTSVLDEPSLTKIDADTYVLIYRQTLDGTCAGPGGTTQKIDSPTRSATVWVRSGDKWLAAFHGVNLIIDPKDAPKAAKAAKSIARRTDATTKALAVVERSVWEAWKAHDRKTIEGLTADSVAFVDIFGNAYANRTDIINAWSGGICKVRSVAVTDAVAFSLSPTVKLLTHTGTADGTCYGAKIDAIYGHSIYVRVGKGWKLAFTMNMPAM